MQEHNDIVSSADSRQTAIFRMNNPPDESEGKITLILKKIKPSDPGKHPNFPAAEKFDKNNRFSACFTEKTGYNNKNDQTGGDNMMKRFPALLLPCVLLATALSAVMPIAGCCSGSKEKTAVLSLVLIRTLEPYHNTKHY